MDTASKKVSDILDNYRAASNLVTELEYWKARCKAAEDYLKSMDWVSQDDDLYIEWMDAVSSEVRKAAYLRDINPPVE